MARWLAIGTGILVGGWEMNKAKKPLHLDQPVPVPVAAVEAAAAVEEQEDWSAWLAAMEETK